MALLAMTFVAASAVPSLAQENNRFAIGVNYSRKMSLDDEARGLSGIGLKWRLGHGRPGWGWDVGLGWFSLEVDRRIGDQDVTLGRLRVKPITAGYGYRYQISRRWNVKGSLVGGISYTTLSLNDEGRSAIRALRGDPNGDASVTRFLPIVRPEVSAWYDIHPKIGIGFSGGYTIARPKITITSSGVSQAARVNADTLSASVGIVYRIR